MFLTIFDTVAHGFRRHFLWVPLVACVCHTPAVAQQNVEQWGRFETSISNATWAGNPFDIVLTADFEHVNSGEILRQYGFYAGDNKWKLYFMPTRTGNWTFRTSSTDGDLNGVSGSFIAGNASNSGPVSPSGRYWRMENGRAIAPTLLAVGPYVRSNPISETRGLVDWADNVAGATFLGTTLLNFEGDGVYTRSQEDRMYIDGASEGVHFYLPAWNRTNAFYDAVRDADMGHYILIYSDDASDPSSHGISEGGSGSLSAAELRLFRYLVARLAPYPKVIWDSGIDIGENRSDTWINNFVAWFHANDPWRHPIASRTGGGSGGIHPRQGDYYSDGERTLRSRSTQVSTVESRTVPTAMTDRYREDYVSPFDGGREKIREAAWQMALTYGTAVYFGGSDAGGYLVETYASDLKAAPDLGVLRTFLNAKVSDLSGLAPRDNIVAAGDAWVATDGSDEYVVFSRSGTSFTLSLGLSGTDFVATWYDPISGREVSAQNILSGSAPMVVSKPGRNAGSTNEWALHIVRATSSKIPKPPEDLVVQ